MTKTGSSDKVFGVLAYSGEPKTLEEMDQGVMAEAARHSSRLRETEPSSIPPHEDDMENGKTT